MDRQILVAKSYQGLPIETEPYKINGKEYVKVRLKSGQLKQVRSYTEKEYAKYNPKVEIIQPAKSQREVFGFGEQGFIWVFKGDTYGALDWFRYQPTRYARPFGWYLPSDMEMPEPLPVGVTPVKLPWEAVKVDDEHMKSEKELVDIVADYIYEAGTSEWLGQIGDRVRDLEVVCTHIAYVNNFYGTSNIITFRDNNGNNIMWTTSSNQNIEEDGRYLLSGTIKTLEKYRAQKQTVLKNCRIKEIEESIL